jgi:hypothetical protein
VSNTEPTTCVADIITARHAELGDAESSLGDATSSLGDATSSLGDAKSSLGDATSSLRDAKSSLGDATSSPEAGEDARRPAVPGREVMLAAIMVALEANLSTFATRGFPALEAAYLRHWLHTGQPVTVVEPPAAGSSSSPSARNLTTAYGDEKKLRIVILRF